jgi:predicted PurR-regulated permease PerM
MKITSQKIYVVLIIAFAATILLLASDVLFPFAIGLALAYFCRPMHGYFCKIGLNKSTSALVCITVVLLAIGLFIATFIPLFVNQAYLLITKLKANKDSINLSLSHIFEQLHILTPQISEKIKAVINDFSSELIKLFSDFLQNLLSSSFAAAHFLSLLMLTPFTFYYFLKDWDSMKHAIYNSLPKQNLNLCKQMFAKLDFILSSYITGRIMICITLGFIYSLMLAILGIDSPLALGMISGILTFIPYIGALVSCFTACLIAAIHYASLEKILLVLTLYGSVQFLEDSFLVPKIIGQSIHLHPLWLIFSLLVAGKILGFIGILLAIPLTAIIQAIISSAINQIKKAG